MAYLQLGLEVDRVAIDCDGNTNIQQRDVVVGDMVVSVPEEMTNFVGCFLTGTAAEVTPVSCIAKNKYKVCEMIIDLNESYQSLVKKKKAA